MLRTTVLATAVALCPLALPAASPSEIDALMEALDTPRLMEILRAEGLSQADVLAEGLFPERGGGPTWNRLVSRLYDTDRMQAQFAEAFAAALVDEDITDTLAFFRSDLGERIVALELSAREAFLDDGVEEAAVEMVGQMRAEDDPRIALLDRFIADNDLIEANVQGGLNSSLAFYAGFVDGGAEMTEDEILREVWQQEPDIRSDTTEWIYSYLALAYRPLPDADLKRYVELAATPEGQALNTALFAAFDPLFEDISRALGQAAGELGQGEDI